MERAALRLTDSIVSIWDKNMKVVVFAGPGNNGGDALAVARMLAVRGYNVSTWLFNTSGRLSDDCKMNRERLKDVKQVASFVMVTEEFDPPTLDEQTLVVDGLFGSGLNKPLTGGFASLVKYVNASPAKVVSIDIPSGLMTESNEYNVRTNIMRADVTLTLQQPKLSFLFPENQQFIGRDVRQQSKLSRQRSLKLRQQHRQQLECRVIRRQQLRGWSNQKLQRSYRWPS